MCRMRSYIAGNIKIQFLVTGIWLLGAGLGGCSHVSVPIGADNVDTPTLITGSLTTSADVAFSDVNADDRGIIAENLDAIAPRLADGQPVDALSLPWLNAISGNSGTMSDINTAILAETGCVTFKTTANTIAGIKLYTGTACRDVRQKFAVTDLSVADA